MVRMRFLFFRHAYAFDYLAISFAAMFIFFDFLSPCRYAMLISLFIAAFAAVTMLRHERLSGRQASGRSLHAAIAAIACCLYADGHDDISMLIYADKFALMTLRLMLPCVLMLPFYMPEDFIVDVDDDFHDEDMMMADIDATMFISMLFLYRSFHFRIADTLR